MGIHEIPSRARLKGYDYCSGAWRDVAVQTSGEVIPARPEVIVTGATVFANAASGGIVLGSGQVEKVIITVPEMDCSGIFAASGTVRGIWVGGRSGTGYEPYTGSGSICSGFGLWVPAGDQKTLEVRKLEEVHVAGEPSGWPVTYLGTRINCV